MSVRKLMECMNNANRALAELDRQTKEVHRLLDDFLPESDLVKLERITYTGPSRSFIKRVFPIFQDPCFRVNGKQNMEAMLRVLDEAFEVRPNNCEKPISFRSLLSLMQEERGKADE